MKLSTNLTLKEVTKSSTATRKNISNVPTHDQLQNLKLLAANIFQPIRDYFDEPIYISSGYRSKKLNKALGGAKKSQHCKGMAIDIDQDFRGGKATNEMVFNYIKDNLEFTQLINENNFSWVHVSFDANNLKNEVLIYKNGRYEFFKQ